QVIVGAAVESGDFVLHSIARGQQENGSCHSAFADAGEYLKAITAGKHHIQKNDVKLLRIDTKKSIFARMRNNRLVSLIFKAFLQGIGDFDLIFDYKNTHAVRLLDRNHAWQTRVTHFTTTVRICAGFDASVQATTISSPERTIRGNTPEPSPAVPDTFIGAAAVPFAATSRIRTWAP